MPTTNPGVFEQKRNNRPKIIVLDANFSWTKNLFSSLADVADILLLYPKDFRAFKKAYGGYFTDWNAQPVAPGIWQQRICCPPGWLFAYWKITELFLTHLIKRFIGNQPSILVFAYPYYSGLAKKLSIPSIYYNMDEYKHYWSGREDATQLAEQNAIRISDLTLCTALFRANYLKGIVTDAYDKIIHLPHGTSEKFILNSVLQYPQSYPSKLDKPTRPVVGYIGALNFRFDFSLLYEVANAMPDVSFLLGGAIPTTKDGDAKWYASVEKIKQLQNVVFIGYIKNDSIMEYIASFDALILPYSQCDFNLNACPMKLWDYMGTSIPMVANDAVPEITLWRDVVHIASDASTFVSKLRFSFENRLWKAQERLDIANQHTWRKQAEKLLVDLREKTSITL